MALCAGNLYVLELPRLETFLADNAQRFAFYTTIPVFIIQLLLVSTAVYAVASSRSNAARLGSDTEKGQSQHELGQVRQASLDTKSDGSPRSVQEARMTTKDAQFA